MPDFTPGEWRFEITKGDHDDLYAHVWVEVPTEFRSSDEDSMENALTICTVFPTEVFPDNREGGVKLGDIKVNARLIAAAPKMYELLTALAREENLKSHVPTVQDFAGDAWEILQSI